jgi:hypothetical protein
MPLSITEHRSVKKMKLKYHILLMIILWSMRHMHLIINILFIVSQMEADKVYDK